LTRLSLRFASRVGTARFRISNTSASTSSNTSRGRGSRGEAVLGLRDLEWQWGQSLIIPVHAGGGGGACALEPLEQALLRHLPQEHLHVFARRGQVRPTRLLLVLLLLFLLLLLSLL
jgi:hypothetical protein